MAGIRRSFYHGRTGAIGPGDPLSMHFSRIVAIVLRVFYLLRGSPARILPLFVWVAIDIVLWGFITKYLNSVTASGVKGGVKGVHPHFW